MTTSLRVRVLRGEALRACDSNGLSDPYVVLRVDGDQKQKSDVIFKTLNPEWNADFVFAEKSSSVGKTLQIEVWDKDSMSADKIGQAEVDVFALSPTATGEAVKEVVVELTHAKHTSNGRVYLSVQRVQDAAASSRRPSAAAAAAPPPSTTSMLSSVKTKTAKALKMTNPLPHHAQGGKGQKRLVVVDVIRARGVPPLDANTNSSDPYVILKLGKTKRSTRIKFRTLAPEWKERFTFSLFDMGGRDPATLEFSLWDNDTVGLDDKIGTLKVDLAALPVGLTDERWWKCQRHLQSKSSSSSIFGGKRRKQQQQQQAASELPDVELLLLITVTDLFEPQLDPTELAAAQKRSKGWLTVNVHRAHGLGAFDANGKSDPFVVVELGNRHMRTSTVRANLFPVWDAALEMPVTEIFDTLYVKVLDEDDNGKFDFMGGLALPLLELPTTGGGGSKGRRWYQLKDASLLHAAEGCIELSFNLHYDRLPLLAKCIARRPVNHMAKEPDFKLALLKSHISRLTKLAVVGVQGAVFVNKMMTWQLGASAAVGFAVGWTLFWHFVQLWHLTFAGLLAVLFLGMLKFRGKGALLGGYEDIEDELEAESEAVGEGGGGDGEDEAEDKPASPGLMAQLRQMKAVARTVQNALGELASASERASNLFMWEAPYLTAVVCLGLFAATLVLLVVPFRYVALLAGLQRVALKGLKKYHPKFKRSAYYVPYLPVVEFIGRVPDDLELEQRKPLPLPAGLP